MGKVELQLLRARRPTEVANLPLGTPLQKLLGSIRVRGRPFFFLQRSRKFSGAQLKFLQMPRLLLVLLVTCAGGGAIPLGSPSPGVPLYPAP